MYARFLLLRLTRSSSRGNTKKSRSAMNNKIMPYLTYHKLSTFNRSVRSLLMPKLERVMPFGARTSISVKSPESTLIIQPATFPIALTRVALLADNSYHVEGLVQFTRVMRAILSSLDEPYGRHVRILIQDCEYLRSSKMKGSFTSMLADYGPAALILEKISN